MEHLQQLLDKAKGAAGRLLKFSVFYRNQHPDYFDQVRSVLHTHLFIVYIKQFQRQLNHSKVFYGKLEAIAHFFFLA